MNWYKSKFPFMAYWTTSVLYLDLQNGCFCLNVWNRVNVQLCELLHGFTMISTKAYRVHYWIIKKTVILIPLNGLPVSNVNTSNTQQCKKIKRNKTFKKARRALQRILSRGDIGETVQPLFFKAGTISNMCKVVNNVLKYD